MSKEDKVLEFGQDFFGRKVVRDTSLTEMDSLDVTEFHLELEEEFDINISEDVAAKWKTLNDVIEFLEDQE